MLLSTPLPSPPLPSPRQSALLLDAGPGSRSDYLDAWFGGRLAAVSLQRLNAATPLLASGPPQGSSSSSSSGSGSSSSLAWRAEVRRLDE